MTAKKIGAGRSLPFDVNSRLRMSAEDLYAGLPDACAKLVMFDPQYRAVLDKMKFGNEGARQKRRAALRQMTDDQIAFLVEEAERVLLPSGHLMQWIDKFTLGSARHLFYLRLAPALRVVDLIHWGTLGFGMGRRTRGASEYLLVIQKLPVRAKGCWTDHGIRDDWAEQSDRSLHPHAKPTVLVERLIRSVTKRGDLVIDPCAGGFGVLDACRRAGRTFVGCDVEG